MQEQGIAPVSDPINNGEVYISAYCVLICFEVLPLVWFAATAPVPIGANVVVTFDRVTHCGTVVVCKDEVTRVLRDSQPFNRAAQRSSLSSQPPRYVAGDVIRLATTEDLRALQRLVTRNQHALSAAHTAASLSPVPVRVLATYFSLDATRLFVYYAAAADVAHRVLAKPLQRLFGVRVWITRVHGKDAMVPIRALSSGGPDAAALEGCLYPQLFVWSNDHTDDNGGGADGGRAMIASILSADSGTPDDGAGPRVSRAWPSAPGGRGSMPSHGDSSGWDHQQGGGWDPSRADSHTGSDTRSVRRDSCESDEALRAQIAQQAQLLQMILAATSGSQSGPMAQQRASQLQPPQHQQRMPFMPSQPQSSQQHYQQHQQHYNAPWQQQQQHQSQQSFQQQRFASQQQHQQPRRASHQQHFSGGGQQQSAFQQHQQHQPHQPFGQHQQHQQPPHHQHKPQSQQTQSGQSGIAGTPQLTPQQIQQAQQLLGHNVSVDAVLALLTMLQQQQQQPSQQQPQAQMQQPFHPVGQQSSMVQVQQLQQQFHDPPRHSGGGAQPQSQQQPFTTYDGTQFSQPPQIGKPATPPHASPLGSPTFKESASQGPVSSSSQSANEVRPGSSADQAPVSCRGSASAFHSDAALERVPAPLMPSLYNGGQDREPSVHSRKSQSSAISDIELFHVFQDKVLEEPRVGGANLREDLHPSVAVAGTEFSKPRTASFDDAADMSLEDGVKGSGLTHTSRPWTVDSSQQMGGSSNESTWRRPSGDEWSNARPSISGFGQSADGPRRCSRSSAQKHQPSPTGSAPGGSYASDLQQQRWAKRLQRRQQLWEQLGAQSQQSHVSAGSGTGL